MSADQDAVNKAAIALAEQWQFMPKGSSREAYGGLMRYEVRDYILDSFAEGVAWARANPSPEVLALVEALKETQRLLAKLVWFDGTPEMAAAFKAKERP